MGNWRIQMQEAYQKELRQGTGGNLEVSSLKRNAAKILLIDDKEMVAAAIGGTFEKVTAWRDWKEKERHSAEPFALPKYKLAREKTVGREEPVELTSRAMVEFGRPGDSSVECRSAKLMRTPLYWSTLFAQEEESNPRQDHEQADLDQQLLCHQKAA